MARIRTIKPEFPQSESVGRLSRDARLLFIQLWTICDDSGITRASSRMLASLLYPYDDDAKDLIDGWMGELEQEKCIVRYNADGSNYLQVCNWLNHQKIDRPSKSRFPTFDECSRMLASNREGSSGDQGPRTKDQGKENKATGVASSSDPLPVPPREFLDLSVLPPDLTPAVWKDFVKHRRGKRAPINTQTVVNTIADELRKAKASGWPPDKALAEAMAAGWTGLNAEWLENRKPTAKQKNRLAI